MSINDRIAEKLRSNLSIQHLEITDNSQQHSGHAGWKEGGETHFNVLVVSDSFSGTNKVARHKMIYAILKEELQERIHALSIRALTPEEYK